MSKVTEYTDLKGRTHPILQAEPALRSAAETERLLDELRLLLAEGESGE